MIAGPDLPIASPMMTKIPVPMIAPMPSAVRSRAPTDRDSERALSSVSATTASVGLTPKRPPKRRCGAVSVAMGAGISPPAWFQTG